MQKKKKVYLVGRGCRRLTRSVYNVYTTAMKTIVRKWGNSLGVRIPGNTAKALGLSNGASVDLIEENNCLVLVPQIKTTLHEMLKKITPENIHQEQFSDIQGKEHL